MAISSGTKFTGPTAYTIAEIGLWLQENGYTGGTGGDGLTSEQIQDMLSTFLVAGTNVTVTYDDVANTLTLASTASGGLSAEEVRDTVASFITAGTNVTVTHNDAADTLTIASVGGSSSVPWLDVKDFGALGNGTADDTQAIQDAIDYALLNNIYTVLIPEGTYKTTDTIHVGYGVGGTGGGNGYNTVAVKGTVFCGHGADTALGKPRVRIIPQFTDRPVFNIQGGRESGIENLWIEGPSPTDTGSWTVTQRADPANYIPSGYKNHGQAPFCGVAIDGYSGDTPPTLPYPVPNYPSYMTPPTDYYNRNFSSNCYVRNCRITRTLIGVVIQPNSNANGDFIDLEGCDFYELHSGVAVGSNQARSTNYDNTRFGAVWTCINGVTFGAGGAGNIAGSMNNIHCDYCYQLLWYDAAWSKPISVTNFYSEVMCRLGATLNRGMDATFISCAFNNLSVQKTPYPDESGIANARIEPFWEGTGAVFENCKIEPAYAVHFGSKVRLKNVHIWPGTYPALEALEDQALWDRMGGVIINDTFDARQGGYQLMDSRVRQPSGSPGEYNMGDDAAYNIFWSQGVSVGMHIPYLLPMSARGETVTLDSVTWSGRSFTAHSNRGYHNVGDFLFDPNGDWLLVKTAVVNGGGGMDLTGVTMTNYTFDGTTYTKLKPTYTGNTVKYFPCSAYDVKYDTGLFMKTTQGSNVIEVIDSNGGATAPPATISTSTKLFWCGSFAAPVAPALPFPLRTTISSIGATTITMSANATRTGTWVMGPGIARLT